jgi:uncharacterized protein YecE (DUF72 family)
MAAYWIGTSGYNYPEWRGSFYPPKLPQAEMLPFYAQRFSTVEINYTFYRMPTEKLLAGWAQATPESFRFTLKAPRRITHDSKLRGVEELTGAFCRVARSLGGRLATLLFQLPPTFKKDVPALEAFLTELPDGTRAAFEFRHESWNDAAVHERLRARDFAWVVADVDDAPPPAPVSTAGWSYLRLRRSSYDDAELDAWRARIAAQPGEAYVFFKHEDEAAAPRLAAALLRLAGAPRRAPLRVPARARGEQAG